MRNVEAIVMMTHSLGLSYDSVVKIRVLPKLTIRTMGVNLFNVIIKLQKVFSLMVKISLSDTYIIAGRVFNSSKGDHLTVIHSSYVQAGEERIHIVIKVGSIPQNTRNRSTSGLLTPSALSVTELYPIASDSF